MSLLDVKVIDGLEGIRGYMKTLDGFHELVRLRMDYVNQCIEYGVPILLRDWVVMNGLFLLLDNGGVATAFTNKKTLTEPFMKLSAVLLSTFRSRLPEVGFNLTHLHLIPLSDSKCSICGGEWDTKTCRNIEVRTSFEYLTFNEYAGLTLREMISLQERETKKVFVVWGVMDRDGKRINLGYDSVLKPGMRGNFEVIAFVHPDCIAKRRRSGRAVRVRVRDSRKLRARQSVVRV